MSSDHVIIALIQKSCTPVPEDNLAAIIREIQAAARKGARIICLQELFASTYFCQTEDSKLFSLAEPVPGPTTDRLAKVAQAEQVVIVAPIFEKRAGGLYHNSAVVIDADGAILGIYRKMHIPDDPLFYEKFYFTPGDLGFKTFTTKYAKIGVLICWDQWFPEGARLTAMGGAQILFYPTAIGWIENEAAAYRPAQLDAWMTMQRSHAIANGVFVAAANRVGQEEKIRFWGNSFVADPFGRVIATANGAKGETLIVPCDLGLVESIRHDWPFLRDRRIDAYGGLTKRYLD